jgi:hypothetical protein
VNCRYDLPTKEYYCNERLKDEYYEHLPYLELPILINGDMYLIEAERSGEQE